MHTPWGKSDYSKSYARGVMFYGTPSHGGLRLSKTKNAQMPDALRLDNGRKGEGWYEEDCDCARVHVAFPNLFPTSLEASKKSLANWNPDAYEALYGPLKPGESHTKDQIQFVADNANNFVGRSAVGDWHADVPKGYVGVTVARATDGAEKTILVTEDDYAARGRFGYVAP